MVLTELGIEGWTGAAVLAAAHGRSRGRSSRSGWHWTPPGSGVARTATRWRYEAEQRVREG